MCSEPRPESLVVSTPSNARNRLRMLPRFCALPQTPPKHHAEGSKPTTPATAPPAPTPALGSGARCCFCYYMERGKGCTEICAVSCALNGCSDDDRALPSWPYLPALPPISSHVATLPNSHLSAFVHPPPSFPAHLWLVCAWCVCAGGDDSDYTVMVRMMNAEVGEGRGMHSAVCDAAQQRA